MDAVSNQLISPTSGDNYVTVRTVANAQVSNQLISPTSGDLPVLADPHQLEQVSNQLISPTSGDYSILGWEEYNVVMGFQSINFSYEWRPLNICVWR